MTNSSDLLELTARLSKNLAIELDLHYEESDSHALVQEIAALADARSVLASSGFPAADMVNHVISRFSN